MFPTKKIIITQNPGSGRKDPLKLQPAIAKAPHASHHKVIIKKKAPAGTTVVLNPQGQPIVTRYSTTAANLPPFIPVPTPAPNPAPVIVAPNGALLLPANLASTKIVKRF